MPDDNNWRFGAKCWGRAADWELETLGRGDRDGKAKAKCAGCPSLIECARGAYADPTTVGVIAAGMAIAGDSLTPDAVRRRLADLLDMPFVSARDAKTLQMKEALTRTVPCTNSGCGHPTLSATAYRNHAAPEGIRARCGDGLCSACWAKRMRENAKYRNALAATA